MKNRKNKVYQNNGNTMRVIALLITAWLFSYSHYSNAQQPNMLVNWAKCMNNAAPFSGAAYGRASAVDASGNFYIAGFYTGTVDFDPGVSTAPLTSVGGLDGFFAKYDINGNFILAKSFGGTHASGDYVHALAVDASGNIYVGGEFFGTADFDPGPGVVNRTSTAQTDAFVAKYDAAGNFVYVNHITGNDFEVVRGLATDLSGNVVVAAYCYQFVSIITGGGTTTIGGNGSYDAVLIKFNPAGNTVFAKILGNYSFDNSYGVGTDASGNVYIAGDFIASINLGAGFISPPAGGNYDVFVAKYSPTGTYMYGKVFGGTGEDWCSGMKVDASGNAYITGHFSNSVDFDPGVGVATVTSFGAKDAYLLKLDNNGNYVYAKGFGGTADDFSNAVTVDGNGNAFIAGSFTSANADFDPGPGVVNFSSAGYHDAYIAKLDASGNYLYARRFGASVGDEVGSGISAYGTYNVFTTGYFTDVVDFNPEAGVNNLGNAGTQNAFMLRFTNDFEIIASAGSNGSVTPAGTTLVLAETNRSYTITPNAGYCIADVLVDGVSQGVVSTYTFTNVLANHTISATFTAAPHWYRDYDGDGYGSPSNDSIACTQPAGYLANNTDCNDSSTLEQPGQIWFTDADGDGYGTGASVTQCIRPVNGYVAAELTSTTGDCNDAANTVNPGATEILCNGIDENCNGMADDGVSSTPATSATSDASFNEICNGGSVNLTVNGGTLGTGASWKWYSGSCGSTPAGTGTSINVSPSGNTTYFVRAEGSCNTSTCVQVTIGVKTTPPATNVVVPSMINLPLYACSGTVVANVNVPPVPGASQYIWDGPTGTTFSGGGNPYISPTSSATITFGNPNGSGYYIGVQAANACGASLRKLQWVRGITSVPTAVTGPSTACANTTQTYNCDSITGATSYLWSVTGDATLTPNGRYVTVNFGPAWTGGTLCVASQTPCYTSPVKCLAISTSASPLTQIIGASPACPGQTLTYSVATVSGAASYTWTLPPGASGTSATNSISVAFGVAFNGGNISVQVTSICGVASAIKTRTISSGVPPVPTSVTGPLTGLCGQTIVYTCPAQSGVTFNWTVPPGATVNSGQGTNAISVTFGTFATSTACVTAGTICGTSNPRCITVKGAPNAPGAITAIPSSWCANTSGVEFGVDVSPLTGSYTLSWLYPGPSVAQYVLGGGNSSSLILNWLSGSGPVHVTASNACGNATRTSTQASSCREEEFSINGTSASLNVYPNPSTGSVNISISASEKESATVFINDASSRIVYSQKVNLLEGNNNIYLNLNSMAKGVYTLSVKTKTSTQKIKLVLS